MDNTNNKEYWNNYVTYWENRVKETNEAKEVKDRTNDDFILETYFQSLNVNGMDTFLDFGCGSGRLYPIYRKSIPDENGKYFGLDISGVSLEHAEKMNKGLKVGDNLKEFDGMRIPFENNAFDKIICFGVFDACNQEVIVQELLRVAKNRGGVLLLTGKNNRYFADDEAAMIAEMNARKKGHPNYFTDVYNLTLQLQQHNARIIETYYFLRRGDFPKNRAVYEMPKIFYEWAYLIEKTEEYKDFEYQKFSDKYSLTFQMNKEEQK
ncbi:MAG: class I SAM-dependent methyltransferase [Lachnospiraceae bacterium]|nr:class I SAM-dependent methyltransferase [Lachnospiraceae bacterium]